MAKTTSERQVQMPSPTDLYNIDHLLNEEERMVRDSVRKFVQDRVLPIIGEHFEAGTFPYHLIPAIADMGLLGMHIEGYGCAGLSSVCYGLACQELEAGDSGLRSFVSVQGSLVMFPISAFGSEEQKQHWLPRMAKGEVIGCFGLTEPDSGSDPSSMRTSARRDGDSYILNGTMVSVASSSSAAPLVSQPVTFTTNFPCVPLSPQNYTSRIVASPPQICYPMCVVYVALFPA